MNSFLPPNDMARDVMRLTQNMGGIPFSRRKALRRCVYGSAGLLLMEPFSINAAPRAAAIAKEGKAKSVIQIWLWGGPCHIDTFDPKPEAGRDYTGALDQTLETNVSGMRIGQLLPQRWFCALFFIFSCARLFHRRALDLSW